MSVQNHELVDLLRELKGKRTVRELAHELNISALHLQDVFKGRCPVGDKLAAALGYTVVATLHISYKKATPTRRVAKQVSAKS